MKSNNLFSIDYYVDIINLAHDHGYKFVTLDEFIALGCPKKKYFIMRHDLDIKPQTMKKMLDAELSCGIRSSIFVRVTANEYNVLSYPMMSLLTFAKNNNFEINENQLVNFKSITEDFFNYLNKEIKICKSENEAKEIALNLSANSPYPVYFFKTDTSGEKLYEEFFTSEDEVNFNLYESIGVITNSFKPSILEMEQTIKAIKALFERKSYSKEDVINTMNKILPNFNHIETGKSLDQKM